MRLLLDTNVLSKIISGRHQNYRTSAAESLLKGDVHCTSVLVLFELEYGALHSPHPEITRQRNRLALSLIANIFSFEKEDAILAAGIREQLGSAGQRIGEYDVFIAAQAVRQKCVMVTNNIKHFSRVDELRVIDWS